MRRRSGRPSASFMRSAIGMVWSCHGASPSSPSPAGLSTAPFCPGESGVEPSSESIPARKPFSQERCPSENGAVAGMISIRGGGVIWFMAWLPLQRAYEGLRRRDGVKGQKRLVGRGAIGEIGLQQLFHGLRRVLCLDVAIDFLPDIGVRAEAAPGIKVITLDRVVIASRRHFCGEQTNVADVMLRAGMMTAGEMDIERRFDRHACFAPVADLGGVTLGIGGRELAAGIAGACDQPGAYL